MAIDNQSLVFLIYGNDERYHRELSYAVASARSFVRNSNSATRIVVVSDEASRRPDLGTDQLVIGPDQLQDWQLGGTYNHATKLFAYRFVMGQTHGKVLMLDTDTWFKEHPDQLFARLQPRHSLMHLDEGPLSQAEYQMAWKDTIMKSRDGALGYDISDGSHMCNSGVVGMHSADAGLLDQAIELMIALYRISGMFTSEQLALALVLDRETTLHFADDIVEHYYGSARAYYIYQIGKIYPQRDASAFTRLFSALPPLLDRVPRNMPDRIFGRLKTRQRAASPAYGEAHILYRKAQSSGPDDEFANVCAELALNLLLYGHRERSLFIQQDFSAFAARNLDRIDWMTPRLKRLWQSYWDSFDPIDTHEAVTAGDPG